MNAFCRKSGKIVTNSRPWELVLTLFTKLQPRPWNLRKAVCTALFFIKPVYGNSESLEELSILLNRRRSNKSPKSPSKRKQNTRVHGRKAGDKKNCLWENEETRLEAEIEIISQLTRSNRCEHTTKLAKAKRKENSFFSARLINFKRSSADTFGFVI